MEGKERSLLLLTLSRFLSRVFLFIRPYPLGVFPILYTLIGFGKGKRENFHEVFVFFRTAHAVLYRPFSFSAIFSILTTMQSLRGFINRLIVGGVAALLIIILSIVLSTYYSSRLQSYTEDFRETLRHINGVISELYRFRLLGLEALDRELLNERLAALDKNLAAGRFFDDLSSLRNLEARLEKGDIEVDEAIDELSGFAGSVSRSYHEEQRIIRRRFNLSLVVQLLFILVNFAALLVMRQSILRFTATVEKDVEAIRTKRHRNAGADYRKDKERGGRLLPDWVEEKRVYDALIQLSQEIDYSYTLTNLIGEGTLEGSIPTIYSFVTAHIPCDRLALAFLDSYGNVTAETAFSVLEDVYLEPGFVEALERTSLINLTDSEEPRIINDLEEHYRNVHQSKSTALILKEGIKSSITVPLFVAGRCVGFLFFSSREKNIYTEAHRYDAKRFSLALTQTLYYHYLIQQIIAESSGAFVSLTEKKDNETSLHLVRMAKYSYILAKTLAPKNPLITPKFLREILWFAQLHDIGKIGIPDTILLKPGKLDEDEWEIMKTHVDIGEEIMRKMDKNLRLHGGLDVLSTAIDIITGHHEKFDGSGYPRSLSGEEIPVAGRIIALTDVFDALTSKRPYKEAFSVEKALSIMREGVGSHFDPTIFASFEESLDAILEVYENYKEV